MAASVGSWRSRGSNVAANLFSKLRLSRNTPSNPFHFPNFRRGIHVSTYDKNVEEEVVPKVVQERAVQTGSDKYWAPHPETGVFGPETDIDPTTSQAPNSNGAEVSVLEQQTFFRPREDLEIPVQEFDDKPTEP